ncbi:hypothetical protein BDN72DRAFT_903601 [Pluteus cervinus]|uniref:Uncharacterized protein n=1 Tax=Pluteus cervinus TaxID=181527 RepID=A0ACD3A8N1_9AGAR|nr:hypothetical protein BDN72DRAFT_903601 [Pluteus cervinus]
MSQSLSTREARIAYLTTFKLDELLEAARIVALAACRFCGFGSGDDDLVVDAASAVGSPAWTSTSQSSPLDLGIPAPMPLPSTPIGKSKKTHVKAEVVSPRVSLFPRLQDASVLASPSRRLHWYAVTVGRDYGVYQGWDVVQELIDGVPGASQQKVRSQAEGLEIIEEARREGRLRRVV